MKTMRLQDILRIEIFKMFIKHYGAKRFDYEYATKTLGFRERAPGYKKRNKGRIVYKSGKTKRQFLSPVITKKQIKWYLSSKLKSRRWFTDNKKFSAVQNTTDFKTILNFVKSVYPTRTLDELIKITRYIIRTNTRKKRREFTAPISVFEELSIVKDKEIQDCANKLKTLKIEGATI